MNTLLQLPHIVKSPNVGLTKKELHLPATRLQLHTKVDQP